MTNYVGVDTRGILDGIEAEIRSVRNDRFLSREERALKISELQSRGLDAYAAARKQADDRLASRRQDATKRRYPADDFGGDVGAEMRLARVREELRAVWEVRGGGPTLDEYERAIASGDALSVRVMERFGPAHISNPDMRTQFRRRVSQEEEARMTDDQRAADEELRGLEQVELNHRMAQNLQDQRARELMDRPAEDLARTRPGEVVEKPGLPSQGSAFHGG